MTKKRFRLNFRQKRALTGFLFISPWLVGFLWFYAKSLVTTVQLSLSDVAISSDGSGYTAVFSGLKNFIYLFTQHATFNQQLVSSLLDMVIDVPLIIFFSLLMAIMLNQKFRGRSLARSIFFLSVILGSGALSTALDTARQMMMGGVSATSAQISQDAASTAGINIDFFLNLFGNLFIPSVVVTYIVGAVSRIYSIVMASGVQIVIFIAALQSVNSSLYEVAKIEGATAYETFWKITFPMVSPLIVTNVVYTVVMSFANSQVVQTAYDAVFTSHNYAVGSAMSLASTVMVCLVLLISCAIISKLTYYEN